MENINSEENRNIKTGKRYRHYKGKEYLVIGVAKHSETLEKMVVYQPLYGEQDLWVRPLTMFIEHITVNGQLIQRFKEID